MKRERGALVFEQHAGMPCRESARQLTQAIERRGMRRIEMNDASAPRARNVLAGERQLDLRK